MPHPTVARITRRLAQFAEIRRHSRMATTCLLVAAQTIIGSQPTSTDEITPQPNDGQWLTKLNALRAQYGAPPVTESRTLSATAAQHAQYMARNDVVSHHHDSHAPGYTDEGHLAATQSNVARASATASDADYVDIWATAPFHMMAMLRPQLTEVGFGHATVSGKGYAALNVIRGLADIPTGTDWPLVFPQHATQYTAYGKVETPDPTTPCGPGDYGTPIIVDFGPPANTMTEAQVHTAVGHLTEDGSPIDVCTTIPADHGDHSWTMDDTRVLLLPRRPLTPGAHYIGSVVSNRGLASIDFTVVPAAD